MPNQGTYKNFLNFMTCISTATNLSVRVFVDATLFIKLVQPILKFLWARDQYLAYPSSRKDSLLEGTIAL